MDNLNYIVFGAALGLITSNLQLITPRPLRNSFLALLLILFFIFITGSPVPAKNYYVFGGVFLNIIGLVFIIMISMAAAHTLLMKGKDKVVTFVFLSILLVVLMLAMWVMLSYLIKHAPLHEFFLGGAVLLTIAVILLIVWLWKYYNIGEEYRKNRNNKRNKKIDIKNEINIGISYRQNNQGIILNTAVVIVLNILAIYYIISLINMAITIDNLFHEGNYLNVYVKAIPVCLFLGLILVFHSSLLNDDLDFLHGGKEKNGKKTSKASILFIKLLLFLEMIIGVFCILISTNTLALLNQEELLLQQDLLCQQCVFI